MRRIRVKLILPALTEATSPYWRPIKYSLFPPLGLATLAAFLDPDDEAVLVDEHVQRLELDDQPDLVLIQVYITNAYRAYRIADHYRARGAFVAMGGLHVTVAAGRSRGARRRAVSRSGRTDLSAVPRRLSRRSSAAGLSIRLGADPRSPAPGAARSDRSTPLPGAELDRGDARLPGTLRLLLQGRVLFRRPIVLHPAGGRGARRDRRACRGGISISSTITCSATGALPGAVRRHARRQPAVPGRGDGRLDPARRSDRAGGRGRAPQSVRRLRDA